MKQITIFLTFFSIFISLTAMNVFASDSQSKTGTLIINTIGFENSNGVAMVALVNSKENYNEEDPFKGYSVDIINGRAIKTITLPYGEYAVKIYHDENGNNELDKNMFGIPKEAYGFSNDARGSLGPPEYEKVMFKLDSQKKEITINIK